MTKTISHPVYLELKTGEFAAFADVAASAELQARLTAGDQRRFSQVLGRLTAHGLLMRPASDNA